MSSNRDEGMTHTRSCTTAAGEDELTEILTLRMDLGMAGMQLAMLASLAMVDR